MARERMVTRTINITKAEVLCVDTQTAKVDSTIYSAFGTQKDKNTLLKSLKKQYETETHKLVSIKQISYEAALYGMSEKDFIEKAELLPDRGITND